MSNLTPLNGQPWVADPSASPDDDMTERVRERNLAAIEASTNLTPEQKAKLNKLVFNGALIDPSILPAQTGGSVTPELAAMINMIPDKADQDAVDAALLTKADQSALEDEEDARVLADATKVNRGPGLETDWAIGEGDGPPPAGFTGEWTDRTANPAGILDVTGGAASYAALLAATDVAADKFFTGRHYDGPALPNSPVTQKIVKSDTFPSSTNLSLATKEWQHDGSQGYILHLTCGPDMGSTAALIGLGIDNGGRGIFVNNKKTGQGIVITQNPTITATDGYGLLINAGKGAAPGAWIQQDPGVGATSYSSAMVFFAYQAVDSSQKLVEFRSPGTIGQSDQYTGKLAGFVRSQDGALIWQSQAIISAPTTTTVPLTLQGTTSQTANLQEWFVLGGPGTVAYMDKSGTMFAQKISAQASGAKLEVNDTGGTSGARRFTVGASSGYMVLSARNDDGTSLRDLMFLKASDRSVGLFNSLSFGGGQGVVAVGNATVAPTTNPTGGGILYAEAGALKWRGPSGTVTTVGVA